MLYGGNSLRIGDDLESKTSTTVGIGGTDWADRICGVISLNIVKVVVSCVRISLITLRWSYCSNNLTTQTVIFISVFLWRIFVKSFSFSFIPWQLQKAENISLIFISPQTEALTINLNAIIFCCVRRCQIAIHNNTDVNLGSD